MAAVFLPFAVTAARRSRCSGATGSAGPTSSSSCFMYLLSGLGVTVGFHRMLTHRAFQTHGDALLLRLPRHARGPGTGDRLGRRPPQAPRAHRRGGRSALPARRRRRRRHGRAEGPLARPHRLALAHARPGPRAQVRQGPRRGSRHARPQQQVPADRARLAADPGRPRRPAELELAEGRAHRPHLGRLRRASSSSTTSPGRSTRSATSSASAASTSRTSRPTSSGSRSRPSASPGTTTTTPSRAPPRTA